MTATLTTVMCSRNRLFPGSDKTVPQACLRFLATITSVNPFVLVKLMIVQVGIKGNLLSQLLVKAIV